jgi:hypothetical protein
MLQPLQNCVPQKAEMAAAKLVAQKLTWVKGMGFSPYISAESVPALAAGGCFSGNSLAVPFFRSLFSRAEGGRRDAGL